MRNPLSIIIFGVTGDLYQSKLAPALFNLFTLGLLPEHFELLGFARRPFTHEEFQELTKQAILKKNAEAEPEKLSLFLKNLQYLQGNFENSQDFIALAASLEDSDAAHNICTDKLFYLATPPSYYKEILKNISTAGLSVPCAPSVPGREQAWSRILVEKPFGKNIHDAEELDRLLGELFAESQIFRIDHYLAKSALQDILAFRFKEKTLENIWNKDHIEKVRVVFHEKNLVGSRGAFYDNLGALRDVGQNHMLQMLALAAMEDPGEGGGAAAFHRARQAVLEKIKLDDSNHSNLLRGQYDGYLSEPGVKENSQTETFFRFFVRLENERYTGVTFELEGGKGLDQSEVKLEIYFKDEPEPKIFPIHSSNGSLYDAYEKVLDYAIEGDQTFFTSTAEIMAEWKIVTEICEKWKTLPLVVYDKGSRAESIL